jgi:hypothetical protein
MINNRHFIIAFLIAAACTIGATACGSDATQPVVGPTADAAATPVDAAEGVVDASQGIIDAGLDSDFGQVSTTYPAFLPQAPQVIAPSGGVSLSHMKVVPVFFPGENHEAEILDMLAKYAASPEWPEAVAEYGVGPLTVVAPIHVAEAFPSPTDDVSLRAWLDTRLNGARAEWGPTDAVTFASSLYVLFAPSGAQVTASGGRKLCTDIYAYHWSMQLGKTGGVVDGGAGDAAATDAATMDGGADGGHAPIGTPVFHALIGRCSIPGLSELAGITSGLSHELVESATDPYDLSPRWNGVDRPHANWGAALGTEIADLCVLPAPSYVTPPSLGYTLARSWSNDRAMAGHDPCVPSAAGPYFNAVPDLPDMVFDSEARASVMGVNLSGSAPRTIALRLYSDGPTAGPWSIRLVDRYAAFNQPAALSLKLDKTTGQNGEIVHLTIQAVDLPVHRSADFFIYSTLGGRDALWIGTAYRTE